MRLLLSFEPDYLDFYTVKEFAQRVRLSEKTVRKYIKAGHIDYRRVGPKLIFIPIEEVDNLYVSPARQGR